jgi:GTPase
MAGEINFPRESEENNIEYKRFLDCENDENKLNKLANQIIRRINSDNDDGYCSGEAIYYIGINDDGSLYNCTEEEYNRSVNILDKILNKINCVKKEISHKLYGESHVGEFLIREKFSKIPIEIIVLMAGSVDAGKCEKRNTPILMFDGTIKMIQDIKKNDLLMGDDSNPRKVLSTITGHGKMYDIGSNKNETYTVTENHILSLKASSIERVTFCDLKCRAWYMKSLKIISRTFNFSNYNYSEDEAYEAAKKFLIEEAPKIEGYIGKGDIVDISVKEFMKLPQKIKNNFKGFKVGVNFPEREVKIDPYILGYWLGDGHSNYSSFTAADSEIVEILKNYAESIGLVFKKVGKSKYTYSITSGTFTGSQNRNSLFEHLKAYNLIKNKHIPDDYKYNSYENRMALLAGLIDSDGYRNKNMIEIAQKSKKLAYDIHFLAGSLGFGSIIKNKIANGKDGNSSLVYRILFTGVGQEKLPIVLERKKVKPFRGTKNPLVYKISITESNETEYFGFELDGNGRYLHSDFVVTHNSSTLGCLISGEKDNGRGKSRLKIFNTKDEIKSGRTMTLAHHILGLDVTGEPIYDNNHTWGDIVNQSKKLIKFVDLAGHEKYAKTTYRGYILIKTGISFIMVGGNMGITNVTREHIFLCINLRIPFCFVITKIDLCENRKNVLEETIKSIKDIMNLPSIRKNVFFIENDDDIFTSAKNIHSLSVVPLFKISNVTMDGIDKLLKFLNLVPQKKMEIQAQYDNNTEFYIDSTFTRKGFPCIVAGQLLMGQIKLDQDLFLGPDSRGNFKKVSIKSIHYNRTNIDATFNHSYYCFALKSINRNEVKKGMVLIDKPICFYEFEAKIAVHYANKKSSEKTIYSRSATIKVGYQPTVHILNVRQNAKILSITNKVSKRQNSDPEVLSHGDRALVHFRFLYKPQYVKVGEDVLFTEGSIRSIGKITQVFPYIKT